MPLALDASTPALVTAANAAAGPAVTASFTPPMNDTVLEAVVMSNGASGANPAITLTNSGAALTWTERVRRSGNEVGAQPGAVIIYTAPMDSSRSLTVSVDNDQTGDFGAIALQVYVWTGVDTTTPVGNVGEGSSTTNNITPNVLTTSVANSWVSGGGSEWEGRGTPSSTDVEAPFNIGSGVLSGEAVRKSAATATPSTVVTLNFDAFGTSSAAWNWAAIELLPAATATIVAIGQVTETDVSQPIGRRKTAVLGRVTETDVSQLVTVSRTIGIGRVTETDSAQPVTSVRRVAVGQVAETDSAHLVGRFKTRGIGQVTETDTAQTLTATRRITIGQVTETDTAQALGRLKTQVTNQVTEVNSASQVTARRDVDVGQVAEVDSAGTVAVLKTVGVGTAVETDLAETITAEHTHLLGVATEVDSATSISTTKTAAVGRVVEVDSANVISAGRTVVTGQTIETDLATAVAVDKIVPLGRATEVDSATAVGAGGSTPVGQAAETNVANALESLKTTSIGVATETDTAGVADTSKTFQVGVAVELDTALAGTAGKVAAVGTVTEIDTTGAVETAKIYTVDAAVETDAAQPTTVVGGATEPPPESEVSLVTQAFIIVTGIGECVRDELIDTEGGEPDRVCLAVPGDIAWDNCDCGQFAQGITGDAPSRVFPISAVEVAHNTCGPPLLVFTVMASVTRCVPTLSETGAPPTCEDLLVAARVMEDDRDALRRAITCCLRDLRASYRVTDFAVGATVSVGPQGGCAGVQITYQFGLNYTCC